MRATSATIEDEDLFREYLLEDPAARRAGNAVGISADDHRARPFCCSRTWQALGKRLSPDQLRPRRQYPPNPRAKSTRPRWISDGAVDDDKAKLVAGVAIQDSSVGLASGLKPTYQSSRFLARHLPTNLCR
jgi:hypothetical protein